MHYCGTCPTSNNADACAPATELEGKKRDGGKNRLDLIPPIPLAYLGRVCQFGAEHYGEHNCEEGFKYSRLIAAAMRHMEAFRLGENKDPESGLPHLAHAAWNLFRLMDQQYHDYGADDRVKRCLRAEDDAYEIVGTLNRGVSDA